MSDCLIGCITLWYLLSLLQYQAGVVFFLFFFLLVIARLPRAISQISPSFLIFSCYLTRLKTREMNCKIWNIGHIGLGVVRVASFRVASYEFFYRRIFLPTFFYKREHLVFSNLKIPLVYLFDFLNSIKTFKT